MGNTSNAAGSTGITDQMLSDASFGDVMQGGTGDFGTGAGPDAFSSPDFGSGFSGFNSFINALSGGGGGAAPIANAQAPVNPQSSPTDAGGGTQSNTQPGQSPQQGQPGQGGQPQQNQQQQQAQPGIETLRDLLNKLVGKPGGPVGLNPPQPPRTPTVPGALSALFGSQPADARLPPDQQGRTITVQPRARPAPPYEPGQTAPPAAPQTTQLGPEAGPAAAPAPAPAPAPAAAPVQPVQPAAPPQSPAGQSRLIRDLAGISHGNPSSLLDLVSALYPIIGGLGIAARGGKPIGHGVNFAGPGEVQDFMDRGEAGKGTAAGLRDPVPGFDKNGQPATGGTFAKNGAFIGSPDKTPTSGQIPGVTPKIADSFIRQEAPKFGIDPDTASKFLGAESGYGQNNLGDYDENGQPTSFGPLQLHFAPGGDAMGDQFRRDTNQDPRNFAQNWKQQIDYALGKAAKEGWSPGWTTSMNKLGLNKWSGIKRDFMASPTASSPLTIAPNLAG